MHAIREEYLVLVDEDPNVPPDQKPGDKYTASTTMCRLLGDDNPQQVDYALLSSYQVKPHLIQAIHEVLDEVDGLYSNIAGQAIDHIHSKYVLDD